MKNTKVTGVRLTNKIKPGPMDHQKKREGYKAGTELKIDDGGSVLKQGPVLLKSCPI